MSHLPPSHFWSYLPVPLLVAILTSGPGRPVMKKALSKPWIIILCRSEELGLLQIRVQLHSLSIPFGPGSPACPDSISCWHLWARILTLVEGGLSFCRISHKAMDIFHTWEGGFQPHFIACFWGCFPHFKIVSNTTNFITKYDGTIIIYVRGCKMNTLDMWHWEWQKSERALFVGCRGAGG